MNAREELRTRFAALDEQRLLGLAELKVAAAPLSAAQTQALARPDPSRPYGREVLWASPELEAMVATWTRESPCAPHDHGGAIGVVTVLQGRARHQMWRVQAGQLLLLAEEKVEAGRSLLCAGELVHSMSDDGAEQPLMTLHLYSPAIPHMVVYDLDAGDTLLVDGGCGAWVPEERSGLLRARLPGLRSPADCGGRVA